MLGSTLKTTKSLFIRNNRDKKKKHWIYINRLTKSNQHVWVLRLVSEEHTLKFSAKCNIKIYASVPIISWVILQARSPRAVHLIYLLHGVYMKSSIVWNSCYCCELVVEIALHSCMSWKIILVYRQYFPDSFYWLHIENEWIYFHYFYPISNSLVGINNTAV